MRSKTNSKCESEDQEAIGSEIGIIGGRVKDQSNKRSKNRAAEAIKGLRLPMGY